MLAVLALGTATSAIAQSSAPPPPPQPRPPAVLINPYDRGPPPQPERPYVGPAPTVQPPMERVTPVAPLAPRVGN